MSNPGIEPVDGQPPHPLPGRGLPPSTIDAFARQAAGQHAGDQRPAPGRPHRSGARTAFTTLLVLGLIAGSGAVLFRDQLFSHQSGPSHPSAWDPRLSTMVAFVEATRELRFEHPVFVDFLPEEKFVALFDQPAGSAPDTADRAATATALFNAKGEAVGYDPFAGRATFDSVTTLGFYSPDDDRVFVRGDQLTPAVRSTLAHELTHALQAQHFQITTGGQHDLELRAIVEADAMRVEAAYTETLNAADQAAVTTEHTTTPEQESALNSVPEAVIDEQYAPYTLGPLLVAQAFGAEGNAGVDALLGAPPAEIALLDPHLYGRTDLAETTVNVASPAGATVLEPPQRLSPLQTLIMLDAWLPWDMARGAIDDWSGGGYVSYRRADGAVCFTAVAAFSQPADRLATAVRWWAGASGSTAAPVIAGSQVTFTGCDRGAGAAAPPPQAVSTLDSLLFEYYFIDRSVAAARDAGNVQSPEQIGAGSRCRARGILSDPSTGPLVLLAELTPEQMAQVQAVSLQAAAVCPVAIAG